MVFFNCNACGEALKKNQVEKHTLRCRQCYTLSCVDCGKDFAGNAYQSHTKCMTEDEKYCGKGYVPKVNKGEAKQEQWIETVQEAISKSSSKPGLRRLLERLQDYPNIPRKKPKFENFLKNSLRISSPQLISEVWAILMEAAPPKSNGQNQDSSQTCVKAADTMSGDQSTTTEKLTQETPEEDQESDKKLSKRERKEERQKKNKKEKKDKLDPEEEVTKKSKKRKHADVENESIESTRSLSDLAPKKKKKKKLNGEESEGLAHNTVENALLLGSGHDAEDQQPNIKTKFDLEGTIMAIVKKKEEISLKKLRKKVLNSFQEEDVSNYNEERLLKKFDKKIAKMQQVKVFKDKVMLQRVLKEKYS